MNHRYLLSALISLCFGVIAAAASSDSSVPPVISLSGVQLAAAKASLARGEPGLQPALKQLVDEADKLLKTKPSSVMDKTKVGPSGDKHDYYSQAPYWWPDPTKPNGLPFIQKDGQVYPDSKVGTDSSAFAKTCNNVQTLGLAYYFTGKSEYAEKASVLTRVWFLDTATRMNPHLNYGQTNPGHDTGRAQGVLEARHLANLTDGLTLLAGSGKWTESDADALKAWLAEYYHWLTTSPIALAEKSGKNNHGTWYAAQAAHLAVYLGKPADAKAIAEDVTTKRIPDQIKADGSQPFEMVRTKSLDYCIFNIDAMARLSTVLDHVGIDLWSFKTSDGRGLYTALNHLASYADPTKPWEKEDIIQETRGHILATLAQVTTRTPNTDYDAELARLSTPANAGDRWRLLWNRPVVGK